MFPIFINDGSQKMPDDDIFYVVCKEGVYLKKRTGVMESMAPVKNISILKSVEATARMYIESIPGHLFAKVISFFQTVYQTHRSEAVVLIFYNEKNDKYKIFPPHQKVNYAGVDYSKGIILDGWQMIGTIHSHANMSAFHSGTDDKDEESFDGIHITIGDNDDEEISISASIVANGSRFIIDPLDYIEDLVITVDIDKTEEEPYKKYYKFVGGKMVESKTSSVKTWRKMDKRYISTVPEKSKQFNVNWMDTVEYVTPTYHYGYAHGVYNPTQWGKHFDANVWRQNRQKALTTKTTPLTGKIPPQNVGEHKVPGVVFPPHEVEGMNPCESCAFKNHKIDWVMEQILDEVEEGETQELSDNMESYECAECHTQLVIPDTQMPVCPICKTDQHLIDTTPYKDDEETFECLKCDVVFQIDEDNPVCPECKSSADLILLDGSVAENEVTEKTWDEEITFKCPKCKKEFYLVSQEECPYCGTNIIDSEAEAMVLSDMTPSGISPDTKVDCLNCKMTFRVSELTMGKECPFCDTILIPDQESDFLDANRDIIEAANAADVQRLPIPGEDTIPINKPAKLKDGPFAFMKKLAKKHRKRPK